MTPSRTLAAAWAKVAAGNGVAGILNLVAFGVATRAAGAETFGVIALMLAWQRTFNGVFNFSAGATVTTYAVGFLHRDDDEGFRGVIKAGFLADAGSGVIAAGLSIILLPLAAPVLGVPAEHVWIGQVVCLISLINIGDATEAALRIFNNFTAIALKDALGAGAVIVALLAFWSLGAVGPELALAWVIGALAGNGYHFAAVARTLAREGRANLVAASARAAIRRATGFWRTMTDQSLQTGLRTITDQADVLIVGAVLGPVAAGLFRAAKSLASALTLIGGPLQKAVTADLARLWAMGDAVAARRLAWRINGAGAGLGLAAVAACWAFGAPAMAVAFGPGYAAGGSVLTALIAAIAITLAGITFQPLSVAAQVSRAFLKATSLGAAVFFALLLPLLITFGPMGAGLAHIAFAALWFTWCAVVLERRMVASA